MSDENCSVIPALALSNALLFADPTFVCLSGLQKASKAWEDAVVLSTPFWLPRTGKLNKPVNLEEGITPLVAASIRFDADRELTVAKGFTPDLVAETTKEALAAAGRIRVLSSFPAASLPALFELMPGLTAVQFANAEQLTSGLTALGSIEGLLELRVTNCRDLTDLSALAALPALHVLNLGGCVNVTDASALALLKELRELRLLGIPVKTDVPDEKVVPSLRTRVVAHAEGDPWGMDEKTLPDDVPVELLGTFAEFLRSNDPDENMQGTLMIRKMLCVDHNAPHDEVIEQGCVLLFVAQLLEDEYPPLQFESAWALTNTASGDSARVNLVLNTPNAVHNFVRLLDSPAEDCREQASWGVGNLAGEDAPSRDMCLECGALEPLLTVVTAEGQQEATVRIAAWALQNLCRHKPPPKHEQIAPALPVLVDMLDHEDEELIVDATWALSYLADGTNDRVQRVLDTGCLPRIIELLGSSASAMITPAIRAIGNLSTGNESQTQAVLDAGVLKALHPVFNHPKRSIRKEVCWTVSNITAGAEGQIQTVIDENIIPALMNATKASEFDVKKEAVWAIANATSGGSKAQVAHLVEIGVLSCLCDVLSVYNSKIVSLALEGIDNVLRVGENDRVEQTLARNPYADSLVDSGHLDSIEIVLNHSETRLVDHAQFILNTYFKEGESDE